VQEEKLLFCITLYVSFNHVKNDRFLAEFHCFSQIMLKIRDKTFGVIKWFSVTPFSRFRPQPSGNNGGQHDTLRLSCHDAKRIEHAER